MFLTIEILLHLFFIQQIFLFKNHLTRYFEIKMCFSFLCKSQRLFIHVLVKCRAHSRALSLFSDVGLQSNARLYRKAVYSMFHVPDFYIFSIGSEYLISECTLFVYILDTFSPVTKVCHPSLLM